MNTIVLQKVSFDFTKIWKTWKGVHPGDGDGPIILETHKRVLNIKGSKTVPVVSVT